MSRDIVNMVYEWGGRFLEPVGENDWRVVDTKKAVNKTSQCLREKRHSPKQRVEGKGAVSEAIKTKACQKEQVEVASKAA